MQNRVENRGLRRLHGFKNKDNLISVIRVIRGRISSVRVCAVRLTADNFRR